MLSHVTMGTIGSKEDSECEGLPARYARGCSSYEFDRSRRQMTMASLSREMSARESDVDKRGADSTSLPRVERHQGMGRRQKSYVEQLLELRNKEKTASLTNTGPVPQPRAAVSSTYLSRDSDRSQFGSAHYRTVVKQVGAEPHLQADSEPTAEAKKKSTKDKLLTVVKGLVGVLGSGDHEEEGDEKERLVEREEVGTPPQPEQAESKDSLPAEVETAKSAVSVVTYTQAKERFELGQSNSGKPKNEEVYRHLEELGLGCWNNDQCQRK